jgi:YbgC/YbaW family acyl-CoA thioester hydrolase
MSFEFRTKRRIEFAETDMAGIVHFSNFFRYMEETEHAFLRSLGVSIHEPLDGKVIGWPRVRAECSFSAPLAFGDEVEIRLLVRKKTKKSITYDFEFSKAGEPAVAHGSVTVLSVAMESSAKRMSSIPIPKCIDEKIEEAPEELLRPCSSASP